MPRTPEQEARFMELSKKFGSESNSPQTGQITDYEPNNPQGFGEWLAQTPLTQGILGYGDALGNMLEAGRTTLTGQKYNPIQTGEGAAYNAGHFGGEITPYFLPGTAAGRIALGSGLGFIQNPEDRAQGAAQGAAFGAIGEGLPYVAKGIGAGTKWLGNKFTRAEDFGKFSNELQKYYETSKKEGSKIINNLLNKFGDNQLSPDAAHQIIQAYERRPDVLTGEVEGLLNAFAENPSLANAQKLQSKTGNLASAINKKGDKFEIAQDLRDARHTVIKNMGSSLEQAAPHAKQSYQDFQRIFSEDVYPMESNPTIEKIIHGQREKIGPKQLSSALNVATEVTNSKIPEGHMMRELQEALARKLKRSELYGTATNALAGGLASGPFAPFGATAGALLGKRFGINAGESAFNTLLNPELARALQNIGKTYPVARATIEATPNLTRGK